MSHLTENDQGRLGSSAECAAKTLLLSNEDSGVTPHAVTAKTATKAATRPIEPKIFRCDRRTSYSLKVKTTHGGILTQKIRSTLLKRIYLPCWVGSYGQVGAFHTCVYTSPLFSNSDTNCKNANDARIKSHTLISLKNGRKRPNRRCRSA